MSKTKTYQKNMSIDDDFLDTLQAKNEFSGFDRSESVDIIRGLIKEIRMLKIIAQTACETLHRSDKEREARAKFEEECG